MAFLLREIEALLLVIISLITCNYGNQAVNCASCFSQKWEWSSWQCDVHCNLQITPFGKFFLFYNLQSRSTEEVYVNSRKKNALAINTLAPKG